MLVTLVGMVKEYFKNHASIEVVMEAHDGEEGIKLAKKEDSYDVLLLDLIMPKKDGVCLLEELNSILLDKKVIVLTSYSSDDILKRITNLGVN